jgi:CRISPR-associated endonuclease Cas2
VPGQCEAFGTFRSCGNVHRQFLMASKSSHSYSNFQAFNLRYVILVYDIEEKRVGKMLKLCRQYLNWIQNSVFEGELTDVKLKKLISKAKKIMVEEKDKASLKNIACFTALYSYNRTIEELKFCSYTGF